MSVRLFWIAVAAYLGLRGALFFFQYQGSHSAELRGRVEKHFSAEDISRGFEYSRRGFAIRIAKTVLDLAILLVIVQAGLAAWLSDWTWSVTGGRWPLQALLFIAILGLGLFLIDLPFDFYMGHVLEKRFQFSTQGAGGWLLVQAKNLLVAGVVSMVVGLLWFGLLRVLPRAWVLVVPAAFAALQVAFIIVMPMVILPLYYKASPLAEGPFRDEVVGVLTRAGIGIKDIFVIDESRYSRHTNAFFTGLGPRKSIYLYDTLLKDHSPKEALTVVGHEAGHWRGDHVLKGLILGVVGMLLGCLALAWLHPRLMQGSGWRPLVDPGSLPALLLLALLAGFFISPIDCGISRHFEREADRAAVELTGDRQSAVEAEERLARTNRSQLLPHPMVVAWYYTHPPAIERIESEAGE